MTSPLAILERSFRRIDVPRMTPRTPTPLCGVYLLVALDEIVYVGGSINIIGRLWSHRIESRSTGAWALRKQFDGALWYPIPTGVLKHYEGAFIRFLNPRHNLSHGPGNIEYDDEIIHGFGLNPADRPAPHELVAYRYRHALREQRLNEDPNDDQDEELQ